MRKVFLMAALIGGVYGTANANGWCRTGTANIHDNGDGSAALTCPGNGVCYETDGTGLVTPGHHILIHLGDELVDAVVVKADAPNTKPPSTPPDEPTDELPSNIIFHYAEATQ